MGAKISQLAKDLVTKSVMYPELYFAWLAKFLNRAQDLLLKPCAIAVNEQGTLLLVDNNAVLVAKLSNPVHVTRLTGGGAPSKAQKCDLRSTAFQSAQGIAFIAREVAVVCDCAANALRILHVNEDGSFQVHISKDKLPKFEIEKPFGVATLVRLDATEPDSGDPRAVVAVTEYDRSTLLILMIEQNARLASKPYSVTRAFRISLQVAASPGPLRPLRGVAGSCTRRTNITVLRNRRDASIAAGEGNAAAIAAAHAQFAEDSRTPSKVYVTRQGSGVISREEESNAKKPKPSTSRPRSDVVAMDIATVLAALSPGSTTVPTGVTAMQDGRRKSRCAVLSLLISRWTRTRVQSLSMQTMSSSRQNGTESSNASRPPRARVRRQRSKANLTPVTPLTRRGGRALSRRTAMPPVAPLETLQQSRRGRAAELCSASTEAAESALRYQKSALYGGSLSGSDFGARRPNSSGRKTRQ
jgi:hypothetical protein